MDTAEHWNIHFENEYTEHRRPAEDLRTMDTKCCIYVGQCEGTYKCIKLELQPWQAQIISCPTITSSQSPTAFPFYTYATIFAPTLYFFLSFFHFFHCNRNYEQGRCGQIYFLQYFVFDLINPLGLSSWWNLHTYASTCVL